MIIDPIGGKVALNDRGQLIPGVYFGPVGGSIVDLLRRAEDPDEPADGFLR